MKRAFFITILGMFILAFQACKEETKTLYGSIEGKVVLMDQNLYADTNMDSITVRLTGEGVDLSIPADEQTGFYSFEKLEYGTYQLNVARPGYIPVVASVNHIGGYSPTIRDLTIYQIPTYRLSSDSIFIGPYTNFDAGFTVDFTLMHGDISGNNEPPGVGYALLGFINTTADVSVDNNTGYIDGYIFTTDIHEGRYIATIHTDYITYDPGITLYAIFYPLAQNESRYGYHKEYLGKPTNVVSFVFTPLD